MLFLRYISRADRRKGVFLLNTKPRFFPSCNNQTHKTFINSLNSIDREKNIQLKLNWFHNVIQTTFSNLQSIDFFVCAVRVWSECVSWSQIEYFICISLHLVDVDAYRFDTHSIWNWRLSFFTRPFQRSAVGIGHFEFEWKEQQKLLRALTTAANVVVSQMQLTIFSEFFFSRHIDAVFFSFIEFSVKSRRFFSSLESHSSHSELLRKWIA